MSEKTVTEVLSEVRQKRAELQAELARLDAVESYLAGFATSAQPAQRELPLTKPEHVKPEPPKADQRFAGLSKWEAVRELLKETGHAMKIGEMVDALAAKGYGEGLSRQVQFNSFYTAISRHPDEITKLSDARYALAEWGGRDVAA